MYYFYNFNQLSKNATAIKYFFSQRTLNESLYDVIKVDLRDTKTWKYTTPEQNGNPALQLTNKIFEITRI